MTSEQLRVERIVLPAGFDPGGGGEVECTGECRSLGPSAIYGGRRDAG